MSGQRGAVGPAEHDVEVAAAGQGPHQGADLKVLLIGDNLEGGVRRRWSSTLLLPSAGVWLAILRVALVREPQQVSTKAARRPCSATYCRRAARSSAPGSSRRGCTVSPLGQAAG